MKLAFNYQKEHVEFEKKDMNKYVIKKVKLIFILLLFLCLTLVGLNMYLNDASIIFLMISSILLLIAISFAIYHLISRNKASYQIKKDYIYLYVDGLFVRKLKVDHIEDSKDKIAVFNAEQKVFHIPLYIKAENKKIFKKEILSLVK